MIARVDDLVRLRGDGILPLDGLATQVAEDGCASLFACVTPAFGCSRIERLRFTEE